MSVINEKFVFKKGQIIHLDSIWDYQAWIIMDGYTRPHRGKHESPHRFNPDTTDEHEVMKDFTVEIKVKITP